MLAHLRSGGHADHTSIRNSVHSQNHTRPPDSSRPNHASPLAWHSALAPEKRRPHRLAQAVPVLLGQIVMICALLLRSREQPSFFWPLSSLAPTLHMQPQQTNISSFLLHLHRLAALCNEGLGLVTSFVTLQQTKIADRHVGPCNKPADFLCRDPLLTLPDPSGSSSSPFKEATAKRGQAQCWCRGSSEMWRHLTHAVLTPDL